MKRAGLCVALISGLIVSPSTLLAQTPDLGDGWRAGPGDWVQARDVRSMLLQRSGEGFAPALGSHFPKGRNVWRCVAEPALGATSCGMIFRTSSDLDRGFRIELGGSEAGGFSIKSARGAKTLWEDKWAPWEPYNAYVLEGIIGDGQVRAQMFLADGKTLVSQSPWIDVPADQMAATHAMALYTQDSRARFWGWETDDEPLSPITDDAPNKRRLVQDEESEWTIIGAGNWMWTDARRQRVRQYASVERTWAVNRAISGRDRVWRCAVKVYPGAGGAGIVIKADEQVENGFLIWLGGTHGAGSLLLYRYPLQQIWGSGQDKWHYDEELILEAETRGAQLRARLLASDGETSIVESPWIDMTPEEAEREGLQALHTWKGSAEFWGFSEETQTAPQSMIAPIESSLGAGWITPGEGSWQWADEEASKRSTAAMTGR